MQLKLDVKEEYLEYQTLKFILQPIVENSILHGFDKTKSGITVQISAERKDDRLYLIVEDDGVGLSLIHISNRNHPSKRYFLPKIPSEASS